MDYAPTCRQRVSGRSRWGRNQDTVGYGFGQEVVIDVNVDYSKVRMGAAINGHLVDSVEVRYRGLFGDSASSCGDRDRFRVCGLVDFWYGTTWLGGRCRDELLVDVPSFGVVDSHAQAMAQEDLGGPAETHALPVAADGVPSGRLKRVFIGRAVVGGLAGSDLGVWPYKVLD